MMRTHPHNLDTRKEALVKASFTQSCDRVSEIQFSILESNDNDDHREGTAQVEVPKDPQSYTH